MHLNGNFAFLLAICRLQENYSKLMNYEHSLETIRCSSFLEKKFLISRWQLVQRLTLFKAKKGKVVPQFCVSEGLEADLEALFLKGFEKDEQKQGKNKSNNEK